MNTLACLTVFFLSSLCQKSYSEVTSSSIKSSPLSSSSTKPSPLSFSSTKPSPLSSSLSKPSPLTSGSTKPSPLSSSSRKPSPLTTTEHPFKTPDQCPHPEFCSEAAKCCQLGVDEYGWIAAAVGWSLWFLTLIILCIDKLTKLKPDEPKYLEV